MRYLIFGITLLLVACSTTKPVLHKKKVHHHYHNKKTTVTSNPNEISLGDPVPAPVGEGPENQKKLDDIYNRLDDLVKKVEANPPPVYVTPTPTPTPSPYLRFQ